MLGDDYDLIGFDPRGDYTQTTTSNEKIIPITCLLGVKFSTPEFLPFRSGLEETAFFNQELITVNSSPSALGYLYERAQLLGELSESRVADVAQYLTTPIVSRDMLLLTDALGEEGIQYWGFSYAFFDTYELHVG